jgi:hypothetical protein
MQQNPPILQIIEVRDFGSATLAGPRNPLYQALLNVYISSEYSKQLIIKMRDPHTLHESSSMNLPKPPARR